MKTEWSQWRFRGLRAIFAERVRFDGFFRLVLAGYYCTTRYQDPALKPGDFNCFGQRLQGKARAYERPFPRSLFSSNLFSSKLRLMPAGSPRPDWAFSIHRTCSSRGVKAFFSRSSQDALTEGVVSVVGEG